METRTITSRHPLSQSDHVTSLEDEGSVGLEWEAVDFCAMQGGGVGDGDLLGVRTRRSGTELGVDAGHDRAVVECVVGLRLELLVASARGTADDDGLSAGLEVELAVVVGGVGGQRDACHGRGGCRRGSRRHVEPKGHRGGEAVMAEVEMVVRCERMVELRRSVVVHDERYQLTLSPSVDVGVEEW